MKNHDFQGKTVLVCGASQGIGEATVRLFAQRGARVVALARSRQKLEALVADLPGAGHVAMVADLNDTARLVSETAPALALLGPTILVNNSGGPKAGPLTEAAPGEILTAIQGHLVAAQILLQACLPKMKERGAGRIVNVISTSVKAPIPNLGVSNVARAAMANWAKTLSLELGPFGVTVNNVLPGYIRTARFDALRATAAQKQGISETQIEEQWKANVPVRRIGDPADMAEAIVFLASDAASYISGINLPVDGGRTPSL